MSWLDDAWLELRHGGLLLEATTLECLPEPPMVRGQAADRLRMAWVGLDSDEPTKGDAFGVLLDEVLEHTCGLNYGWSKGSAVGATETERLLDGTELKPRRIWSGVRDERLLVFTTPAEELGRGRGRRPCAQVVEYLRRRGQPLGLLTNGREWRLYWADRDNQAWVEWAADRWFEGDQLARTAQLLRRVVSSRTLARDEEAELSPLLAAIRETRRGQAKLSKDLGERVRRAVETFLRARRPILEPAWGQHRSTDLYGAACHLVMRVVVILFAEARELLPVDSPIYHHGYGLRGLLDQLDRLGPERRRARHAAWPRLLALFRLLHDGSPHPEVSVPAYGGDLFAPGNNATTGDGHLRALHLLEDGAQPPDDETIYQLLVYLTRTKQRVRDGAGWRTVAAPVDFTELTSEYVGILYEGLLDYELKRADSEPMIFLNLGDQPALPLNRLEDMDEKALAALVAKAKVKRGAVASEADAEEAEEGEEDASEDEADGEIPEATDTEEELGADADPEPSGDDALAATRVRALAWAERAAVAGKLVKKPNGKKGATDAAYQVSLQAAAKSLVADVKLPGELYLVRWGGTRKGAGTFYTRPQLTLPTVRRTLEPLLHDAAGKPRTPEDVLGLKVCDPAMGSGSFLIAALRILTRAVIEALHHHGRVTREGDRLRLACDLLPEADRAMSEDQLEARVRRVVVEHCLYGVDIDPLAVRLAQVALWIETLDRRLPFTFLDHKLRCGDSLIGTWLDRFRVYPLLAWSRQSADEKWSGVHHPAKRWHAALRERQKAVVAEQAELLKGQTSLTFAALSDDDLREAVERVRRLYRDLRAVPAQQPDKRAQLWRERIQHDPALDRVRAAFDLWCSLWFWPLDSLSQAPGPRELHRLSAEAQQIAQDVARSRRFFHWELEFPDVFVSPGSGFDAIVGNPPWETRKPSSKEFFSNHDPLYRSYGKQDALRRQKELFAAAPRVEEGWLSYLGEFKDAGNFVRNAAEPFGDGKVAKHGGDDVSLARGTAGEALHRKWKTQRSRQTGCADPEHPFIHQGSADLNTYKLFLEQGHCLLRAGGLIGMVTPSAIYTDQGSLELRRLFLSRCAWRWLYGFENRRRIFDIDSRFKFNVAIVQKGASTSAIRVAFMRHELEDWDGALGALDYPAERVREFSPASLTILEIQSTQDLDALTKLSRNSVLLGSVGDECWGVRYAREFDTTNDSKLFVARDTAEAAGAVPDELGRWITSAGEVLIPLYEGRMIGQFDFSKKGWVSGRGRGAVWEEIAWDRKQVQPQYLIDSRTAATTRLKPGPKAAYMRIGSATNARTVFSTYLRDTPAADSVFYFLPSTDSPEPERVAARLVGVFGSFVFDWAVRARVGGLNLSEFIMVETPLPKRSAAAGWLEKLTMRLACGSPWFAPEWLKVVGPGPVPWRQLWACTPHERTRLRAMLDAAVALCFGFGPDDLRWVLNECDLPREQLANKAFCRRLNPKGFWRADRDRDPEFRQSVLAILAFEDLAKVFKAEGGRLDRALERFLSEGEGWTIPESVCLSAHGLGHDDRAKKPQPVASRLGPRFFNWQLAQTPHESWAECERHARVLLGDAEFERRFGSSRQAAPPASASAAHRDKRSRAERSPNGTLFPEAEA